MTFTERGFILANAYACTAASPHQLKMWLLILLSNVPMERRVPGRIAQHTQQLTVEVESNQNSGWGSQYYYTELEMKKIQVARAFQNKIEQTVQFSSSVHYSGMRVKWKFPYASQDFVKSNFQSFQTIRR